MAGNRGGKHGEITGQVGVPPPPGAPIQHAQPITPAAQAEMERAARANSQELPAFNPKLPEGGLSESAARMRELDALMGGTKRARPPVTAQAADTVPASTIIITDADPPAPPAPDVAPPAVVVATAEILVDQSPPSAPDVAPAAADNIPRVDVPDRTALAGSALARAAAERNDARPRSTQPAASNTDSPSRGMPSPVADPGKQITGGFGAAADQQYFPLDGSELREVVLGLMDKLAAQLTNDLRFTPALCYPRVSARVTVHIDCYAREMSFEIPKAAESHKTPIDVALAHGAEPDSMQLEATVGEFDPTTGETDKSTNAMRRELGLQVPMKQRVRTPTGFSTVDRLA